MSDTALRAGLIRLAHARPDLRTHILPLVTGRVAMEFDSQEALEKYLKDHPKADKSKHTVKKNDGGKKDKGKGKKDIQFEVDDATLEKRRPAISDDLKSYGLDADPEDLKPEHREAIKEYKLEVVGKDAAQAVDIARKIKEGIEASADICKMNPAVCSGNKGLTRDKMPQIEGEKTVKQMLNAVKKDGSPDEEARAKGRAMVQAGADPDSDKTVMQQMIDHFKDNGVRTRNTKVPVGMLKATQSEIKATKTYGMADSYLKGKFPNIGDSVIVSRDGHILDGHHRWAALLTVDPSREMNVQVIDMDMDDLLSEAQAIPGVYKADFKGNPLGEDDQKEYKSKSKTKFKAKGKGDKSSEGGGKSLSPADSKKLGEALSQWHESGSDPIYAVSSNAAAGKPIPPEAAKKALSKIDTLLMGDMSPADKKQLSSAKAMLEKVTGTKSEGGGKAKSEKPKKTYKKNYRPKMESVMDKHDLTDDDAAAVIEFSTDRPRKGKEQTPAELMRRFLAKAKPETKERMKGMNPNEFMVMLRAILDDEEGGAGKTASVNVQAAYNARIDADRTRLQAEVVRLAHGNPNLRTRLASVLRDIHVDRAVRAAIGSDPHGVRGTYLREEVPMNRNSSAPQSLADLEKALWRARRDAFSDDEAVADAAAIEIKRLRKLVEAHPDEVRRRDQVKQRQDERMWRLWE